jgi:hypothetical protein
MRRGIIGLSLLLTISLIPANSATPPKAGSICSKQGVTKTYQGKKFTCIKSGKKLVWDKGFPVKTGSPTSSPLPQPSSTSIPSATPSVTPAVTPSVTPAATPSVNSDLSKCSNENIFKRLPVELSKISYVAPIGVLAPVGGSPLPKQHTGFMLNEYGVPIFAPGDLTIIQIRKVSYNVSPTRPGYIDYAIFFSVCDEVRGHFGHITNLNPMLQARASDYQCSSYSTVDETVESCTANVKIKVAEGTQIATSGTASHSPAVDIGMSDSRVTDGYLNAARYGKDNAPGTICPWDFYIESVKTQIYSKIGLSATSLSTESPKCGTLAIDRFGTAAGRWTSKDNPGNGFDPADGKFLVLVADTYRPQTRIAYSTRLDGIASNLQFEPVNYPRFPVQESGRVNRQPTQITDDGNIYCYVVDLTTSTESFLVQLINKSELKVEKVMHQAGASSCSRAINEWNFSSRAITLIR